MTISLSEIEIRRVRQDDLTRVSDLLRRSWHWTYDGELGADSVASISTRFHSVENLESLLNNPSKAFLLAEVAGDIVGTASARPTDGNGVYLQFLYVDQDYHGTGVGYHLLKRVIRPFERGVTVQLEVSMSNTRAIAFYRRFGFQVIGETVDCIDGHVNLQTYQMAYET